MKILIITTINDLSIPLFLMAAKKLNITCDFLFYEQKEQDFKNIGKSHDHIYMRDPFNHTYDIDHIKNITTEIIHNTDPTKIIDNLD